MKLKVLNLEYDVIEVPTIEHGSLEIGRVNHLEQKIFIKAGLSNERRKVTLIHEAIHSIFQQLGFNEEHDNEHLISSLATALYQVLNDNKKLDV